MLRAAIVMYSLTNKAFIGIDRSFDSPLYKRFFKVQKVVLDFLNVLHI